VVVVVVGGAGGVDGFLRAGAFGAIVLSHRPPSFVAVGVFEGGGTPCTV